MFDNDSDGHGIVNHDDIHRNLRDEPDTIHKDSHDHSKIHEAMHLGQDNINNPLNH